MAGFEKKAADPAPDRGATRIPWLEPEEHTDAPVPQPLERPGAPDPTALLPWMDELGPALAGPTSPVLTQQMKDEANWRVVTQTPPRAHNQLQEIVLPPEVVKSLDQASKASQVNGKEHGGNIVHDGGDYSTVDTTDETANDSTFWPDRNQTNGNDFVGGYHTHVTDAKTTENTTFSESDMTQLLGEGHNIEVMRAGNSTKMLARTKEFEEIMDKAENLDDLGHEMEDAYNQAYAAALGGDIQRAAKDPKEHERATEAAVIATATKYKLMYFAGDRNVLKRRGPGAKPPPLKTTSIPPTIIR